MPAAGQPRAQGAQSPRIVGTVVAIFMAVVMIPIGLLIAMSQALNLKFLEDFVEVQPGVQANFLGLFGLFIFGVGLAMLLTQVFAEKYSAKLSGLTFAGTLAALLLFMLIARYTIFNIDPDAVQAPPEQKRALSLQIQCPASGESTAARRAFIMIVPGARAEGEVREAFDNSPVHNRLIVDPSTAPELAGVAIPDRAIVMRPEFNFGTTYGFSLPRMIHSELDTRMMIFTMSQTGSAATSELSSPQILAEREIVTIMFRPQFPDPTIETFVDFTRVREVCGA